MFWAWRERAWAEWIGIVSGGVYLPVKVYELVNRPTVLKARPADCQRRDCGPFVFYEIPSFQWFTATILIIQAASR
jgi:predicted membrane protein DUF2127